MTVKATLSTLNNVVGRGKKEQSLILKNGWILI